MPLRVEIQVGRVLQSTKANKFHKLPSHAWSVVVVGPHDAEALRFKNKTEVIDIIFYTTQHDAMEESAYLVGKRPDEREADTALRRSRSVGGIIQGMTVAVAGGIGVGRTAGVINTSGMSVGTAPVPVVDAKTAEEEAVAAVWSRLSLLRWGTRSR